ncbi:MerR family transcriptional regulator [Sphingomonas edaphi]|uniref:Mercuric resistance operon regulatory protein n=1 Tax=Sphingomonas edaphi TaxID=2315689 RepID=A0A418Q0M4_9SPHN|nr:MerR family transcriptional regulator [Sphingomonas edaphi]RIX29393.1 MerR family transcriptional regulator [Sphingomonas edaphi]
MVDLTIGTLAAQAGVGVETVRFYQRKGLLAVPARAGGIRRYSTADVERIRFIKRAQAAGFTLSEIAELIALDAGEDRARARELAGSRIAALDEKIEELKQARASLARLARECSEAGQGPCPIIASFE